MSSIHTCFSSCPPLVHRRNQTKKCNIWTGAKDGKGVASLASVSLMMMMMMMSRPEASSSQNREMVPAISNNDRQRKLSDHFDFCYMATGLGMSAKDGCLPQQCLLDSCLLSVNLRTKVLERLTSANLACFFFSQSSVPTVTTSHSGANEIYFPQIKFYI